MNHILFSLFIRLSPRRYLSRFVGFLSRLRLPSSLQKRVNRWFVRRYHINVEEMEFVPEDYVTLNQLFTRSLKKGARPIAPESWLHPVDGELKQAKVVEKGELLQVKNWKYHLAGFLSDSQWAADLEGGDYFHYYLCPTDYHRVHSPVEGRVTRVTHIPGDLWPVNQWSLENIRNLFVRNERVVFEIEIPGHQTKAALVMIGATNVGQMEVAFEPSIRTNRTLGDHFVEIIYKEPVKIDKGALMGIFHMGSSVVLIRPSGCRSEKGMSKISKGPVRYGSPLGG